MPLSALNIEDSIPNQEGLSPSVPLQNRPKSTSDVSVKSWPLLSDEFTTIHSRATSVPNMSLEVGRTKSAGPANIEGMKLPISTTMTFKRVVPFIQWRYRFEQLLKATSLKGA